MIRDPSDGTVKETPKSAPVRTAPQKTAERLPSSDAAGAGADTGLRQPTRADAQERLERSRKWLKDYQEKQHARGSNGEEHSTDGRTGNEAGEGQP